MSNTIKQGFQTPDGVIHESMAAARDHLRKPEITKALNALNGNNTELTEWLLAQQESVEATFESTKIQRVTKSEKAQLVKALEEVAKSHATVTVAEGQAPVITNVEKKFAFLIDNAEAIADSFRWPSVKRGTEAEQAATIRAGFMTLTGDNAELVDWIIGNKDGLLEAYQAGVVKREVNPKAADALAKYRADQAAKKAAAEAEKAKAAA